jgi:hypothetical protein
MSSSRRVLRVGLVALALVLPLALGACSGLRPLYGDNGVGSQRVEVHYAAPKTRLDQIVYQDLALKLGKSPGGPLVTVVTSQVARPLTSQATVVANQPYQVVVTGVISVVAEDGTVLFSGTRSQSADYTQGPQVLANQQAAQNAAENAAHLLADTIRLAILGALAK